MTHRYIILTCFGPKCPKTGHFALCTSCAAGTHAGLSSAVLPCAGTLWWRSIFALFLFSTFFGRLWPNPMFFFSMAFSHFFRTPDTCHVVAQSPKPQPSWPPTMWWRSVLIGFAIFVPGQGVPAPQGGTREGKLLWNVQSVQPAKFGGQTKCLAMGVGRPRGVLPCAGGQIGWWFASFRALVAKGGPFCVCKCGVPAGLVSKNAQTPPKVNQNGPTGRRECQTGPLFSKNGPKKTLCSCLRPLWQAPLGNVPISCNLAQNLSRTICGQRFVRQRFSGGQSQI